MGYHPPSTTRRVFLASLPVRVPAWDTAGDRPRFTSVRPFVRASGPNARRREARGRTNGRTIATPGSRRNRLTRGTARRAIQSARKTRTVVWIWVRAFNAPVSLLGPFPARWPAVHRRWTAKGMSAARTLAGHTRDVAGRPSSGSRVPWFRLKRGAPDCAAPVDWETPPNFAWRWRGKWPRSATRECP